MNICFEKTFSNKHTNMIKGCAAIMLLFHHLFFEYATIQSCFTFCHEEKMILYYTAQMCKVCVALFLVLSGYGLMKSAQKVKGIVSLRFSIVYIAKLLLSFWFVYILFVPPGFLLGRNPISVYGKEGIGILNFFCDFFGISYLTGTPTFNITWWYMGEILRLYFLFPVLYYGIKTNPLIVLIGSIGLCFSWDIVWFLPFVVGMLAAEKNLFEKYMGLPSKQKLLWIVAGIGTIPLRMLYNEYVDTLFALWIIAVILFVFRPEKTGGRMLSFIGEHSGNIFMFHTFIYLYYFESFIYCFRSPYLIIIALLLVGLLLSVAMEWLKKVLRYRVAEERIRQLITNARIVVDKKSCL